MDKTKGGQKRGWQIRRGNLIRCDQYKFLLLLLMNFNTIQKWTTKRKRLDENNESETKRIWINGWKKWADKSVKDNEKRKSNELGGSEEITRKQPDENFDKKKRDSP